MFRKDRVSFGITVFADTHRNTMSRKCTYSNPSFSHRKTTGNFIEFISELMLHECVFLAEQLRLAAYSLGINLFSDKLVSPFLSQFSSFKRLGTASHHKHHSSVPARCGAKTQTGFHHLVICFMCLCFCSYSCMWLGRWP